MFVLPLEDTSTIDLTQRSHKCCKEYEHAVEKYLFSYKVLLKKLPVEIVRIIMDKLDPRNDVHVFGLCSGKVDKCGKYLTLNTCPKCFLKITKHKSSQMSPSLP